MNPTTRLLLPTDVALAPVAGLPAELRRKVSHESGDFYVTRPHTRAGSMIVDARTAALLEHFRAPSTVIDAIVAFCAARPLDAARTLDEAFATLGELVAAKLLVPADSALAEPIMSSLSSGQRVGDVEIIEPIHLLDDTEVYRGRFADGADVALKIVAADIRRHTVVSLQHEANVLARLDGAANPALLGGGRFEGRAFIVTAWLPGVDLYRAAGEAHALPEPARSATLLRLAERILRAYAHLHAQGALHADVHPRNVIIDADDRVTVLDFGLASLPAAGAVGLHGGIDLFLAPELAAAMLSSAPMPAPSVASEQYSLGAMLYLMLTGGHTHAFSLQPDTMLRQLVDEPPLPFSHHGASGAVVEQWIARAMAKDPADRYPSIAAMLQALPPPEPAPTADYGAGDAARALLEAVLHRCRVPGDLYSRELQAPSGSVSRGAAGIAYFLLRMARDRDDDTLLAAADQWLTRAAAALDRPETFWNAERGIVPDILGHSSLFHHACGLHCTQALIAHGRGDDAALHQAVAAYAAAADACDRIDVAFGWSGLLIGCAMLLDVRPAPAARAALLTLGSDLARRLWARLDSGPALEDSLGAAHGWCGYLYATLRWCAAADEAAPAPLRAHLAQLAALGQPVGRALYWPRRAGDAHGQGVLSASWCNGAAGYVHLWTAASGLPDAGIDCGRLARQAAWHAYQGPTDAPGDLCCGLAGRAYALLRLYRWCGEPVWLARAALLARRAAAAPGIAPDHANSLFHGELGIAMLAADLAAPAFACMPFFEDERWTAPAR